MKKTKLFSALLVLTGLALILSAGFTAFAATTANQGVTFGNPVTASISLTAGGATHDFGDATPGVAITANAAATVEGTANAAWSVTVQGGDFSDGTNTILTEDCFKVKGGSIAAFTSIDTPKSITAGHALGTASFIMDYELNVPTAAPGSASDYSGTLTYTISTT